MVEITPMTINNPKCIDVNEVIVHPSKILQSFEFCAKKGLTKMTMNENARQHICINMGNVWMLTSISHNFQIIYFSHKLPFIMDSTSGKFLDIDESNLPFFARPSNPNQSSSSSIALVLGLAGVVQAIIVNRQSREPLSTQEFIMCAHQETQREFNRNSWLCALEFVQSCGQLL